MDKDAVVVDAVDEDGVMVLTVSVAPDDMGRIIGKKGRIASALRTVIRAAAGDDVDVNIEISEY